MLTSFYNAGGTSFQYDSYGLRTAKADYATTTTTHFYYDASGNLIREQRVPNGTGYEVNILYLYDASGSIFGLTYYTGNTQTTYYFGKNLQGDVLCIYDASGTTVARYNYDAWGACTIAYDNTSEDKNTVL